MRKEIIITNLTFITLLGCNITTNNEIKPTTSATSSVSPITTTTSIRSEDKYCYQVYCKAISKEDIENPKINKPIDLAVSNDGKNVYVVNTRIRAAPEGICGNKDKSENYMEVPRAYIYKITQDKKLSVLKINDNYDYSCKVGGLESDKDNNLYTIKRELDTNKDGGVGTLSYNILKLENESKISKIYTLKKEENTGYNYTVNQLNVSKFDNNITYAQTPYNPMSIKTINKINENDSIDTLYKDNSYGGAGVPPFMFEDNKLNFGSYEVKEPFPFTMNSFDNPQIINKLPNYPKFTHSIVSMKMNSKKEVFAIANTIIYKPDGYSVDLKLENKIYKIVPDKGFEVFAGSEEAGYKDGNGSDARFNNPSSIDFDANDNMYVADTGNNAIRKITPNGDVTTFFKQE